MDKKEYLIETLEDCLNIPDGREEDFCNSFLQYIKIAKEIRATFKAEFIGEGIVVPQNSISFTWIDDDREDAYLSISIQDNNSGKKSEITFNEEGEIIERKE